MESLSDRREGGQHLHNHQVQKAYTQRSAQGKPPEPRVPLTKIEGRKQH